MEIIYDWDITQFDVQNVNGMENVIVQACFVCKGTKGTLQGMDGSDVKLLPPDAATFVGLDQVTKDQAVVWVKAALGDRVAEFQGRVAEQISWQESPDKVVSQKPSWAASE